MTLRTVLLSLQALLSAAEPDDPQDAVVASQYKENYEMFALTAKHWTNAYAGGNLIYYLRIDPILIFLIWRTLKYYNLFLFILLRFRSKSDTRL